MPAQKKTATGLFAALLGILGFSVIAGLLVTVMVAPAIAVTGVTANSTIGIFNALPDYFVLDAQHQRNQFVAIDSKGRTIPIADIYDQNRQEVDLSQIGKYAQYAAIDGEDRRFYDHGGVDIASAIRAAITNATNTGSSGGSTLSMQLVRNILVLRAVNDTSLTEAQREQAVADATYPDLNRKLKEMKYAIGLEKKYSKDEILAGYLNIVGMGGNTYGIEAGAEQFFNTTADKLTPAQAASLVAIVQNPNHNTLNDPANYAANEKRRNVILGWMYTDGHIDKKQFDEAIATKVDKKFVTPTAPKNGCLSAAIAYRWPCDYAYNSIKNGEVSALGATRDEQLANFHKGGYTFVLTINPGLQNTATKIIHADAPNTETRFQLGAAASTVQVGTGQILVMAQNKDFNNTAKGGGRTTTAVNFNADISHGGGSGFQPGSTYKPYTLLNFLKSGHGLNEVFDASKRQFQPSDFAAKCAPNGGPSFIVRNDEGEGGPYTVMHGTARSVNSVFMQMGAEVDQCDTKDVAISLGVHRGDGATDGSDLQTLPSCVIGGCQNNITPLTQAAAYAAIANHGVFCKPIIIKQVLAADGTKLPGQDADCGQSSQVAPNVANTAAYAMQGVITGNGTAITSNPQDGTPYIAKTGTTDSSRHTWMIGSSTAASTAVWVGNIKGTQALRQISVNGTNAAETVTVNPSSTRPQAAHRGSGVRAKQPRGHDSGSGA